MEQKQAQLRSSSDQPVPQPSIADRYADLLGLLGHRERQGLIVRLTVGYYDGWRPSRSEVADLVAEKLKIMTIEKFLDRQLMRNSGRNPPNIADRLLQASRLQQRRY